MILQTTADKSISAFLHSWMDLVNLEAPRHDYNPVMVSGRKPAVRLNVESGTSIEIQFRSLRLARRFYKLIKNCRSFYPVSVTGDSFYPVSDTGDSCTAVTVKFEFNLAR